MSRWRCTTFKEANFIFRIKQFCRIVTTLGLPIPLLFAKLDTKIRYNFAFVFFFFPESRVCPGGDEKTTDRITAAVFLMHNDTNRALHIGYNYYYSFPPSYVLIV